MVATAFPRALGVCLNSCFGYDQGRLAMQHRVIPVRLAEGDAGGVVAEIRLQHGGQSSPTLALHPGNRSATFEYDVDEAEEIPNHQRGWRGYSFRVEWRWGYARERSYSGESNADELIVPAREGTVRVVGTALEAGVERVVLTSSVAAIRGGNEGRPLDESVWSETGCTCVLVTSARDTLR